VHQGLGERSIRTGEEDDVKIKSAIKAGPKGCTVCPR
jgi:hypothetical protein